MLRYHSDSEKPRHWRALLGMLPPRFRVFLLSGGVFGIGNFAATFLVLRATTLLVPRFGTVTGSALAVGLYTLYNVAYAAGAYLAGEVADRVPKVIVLGFEYLLFGAAGFGVVFAVAGVLLLPRVLRTPEPGAP